MSRKTVKQSLYYLKLNMFITGGKCYSGDSIIDMLLILTGRSRAQPGGGRFH